MIAYTLNKYGLREKDMLYLQKLFAGMPAIEKVLLYGSRANGNYETGSDVDLALVGEKISFSEVSQLHYILENENPMLLGFDVLHYDNLKNEKLKQRIKEEGIIIYERK